MILCMPTVGQKVRVLDGQEWTFRLYQEYRNESLYTFVGKPLLPLHQRSFYDDYEGGQKAYEAARAGKAEYPPLKHIIVSLPGETVLTIDRIFLRKGNSEFDSISFILNGAKLAGEKGVRARVRFWVKLEDVNTGRLELL